ncbi:MAG: nucleotidyltransferase family protein [Actinobacteria bacterium]|nr:nucleotidyltransferase family protein [Actinomycetota bacterium]
MDGAERLRAHRDEILRIAAKYGAHNVRVFGSIARSEADAESDIDLLVDLEPGRSLFDLGGLWADLNALLGMRDRIGDRVLREAVPL